MHPEINLPSQNLIRLLLRLSRFTEAHEILLQTNEFLRNSASVNDLTRIRNTETQMMVSEVFGRHRLALELNKEFFRLHYNVAGSNNEVGNWIRMHRVNLLIKLGALDNAQQLVDKLFKNLGDVNSQELFPDNRRELYALSARIAIVRSEWEPATKHLYLATIFKAERTHRNQRITSTTDLLLGVIERHNKHPDRAIKLHADALAQGKTFYKGDSANLDEFYIELARSLILAKRYEDARTHLNTAHATLEKALSSDNARLSTVWAARGDLELAQNNIPEAREALKRAIDLFDPQNFDPIRLNSLCIKHRTLNPREFSSKCSPSNLSR